MGKSLLFVINGFGMGNATRCESLMDILAQDYRIDVITSDNAYRYFENNPKVRSLYRQDDLNLKKKHRFGSFRYYANYIPHFFGRLFRNYKLQKEILKAGNYDSVIFDSDYAFILHALLSGRRNLLGLNNSFEIVRFLARNPASLKLSLVPSFLLECADLAVHLLFCNWILCPCLGHDGTEEKKSALGKVLLLPPLVRKALLKSATLLPQQVLVMESSSNVFSGLENLANTKKLHGFDFITGGFMLNNLQWLAESPYVICNSGQSSISECLYLNKKALISAIPRHAEQHVNSLIACQKGLHLLDGKNLHGSIQSIASLPDMNFNFDYERTVVEVEHQFGRIRGQTP